MLPLCHHLPDVQITIVQRVQHHSAQSTVTPQARQLGPPDQTFCLLLLCACHSVPDAPVLSKVDGRQIFLIIIIGLRGGGVVVFAIFVPYADLAQRHIENPMHKHAQEYRVQARAQLGPFADLWYRRLVTEDCLLQGLRNAPDTFSPIDAAPNAGASCMAAVANELASDPQLTIQALHQLLQRH